MFKTIVIVLICFIANCENFEWYESANFYQIYPRSFMDSNGDGVGDLQGIKSKLQYIKDLGIDGIWLSPIFKSPQADFGYDISDFRDIDDEFGTLQDFDALAEECKKIGLRLILDFVPNHSSDEHEWFKKSERREPGYEDYYIWRDGKVDTISNSMVPTNNWISRFRYSAWRWSDIRQQMYYHMFHYKQPDLNYRNPKLVQEMKDILTYWMEKGVDGFRIDAISTLFEKINDDGSFPDEPRSYNPNCDRYDDCSLQHIYVRNQNETYDMVYQWRKLVDDFHSQNHGNAVVLMVESYQEISLTMRYYGEESVEGAQVPFNFELLKRVTNESNAEDYKNTIEEWMNKMPEGKQANWVLGNHDQNRLVSRLGVDRGDLLNILLQTLPGIAITYQGEELLMEDVELSWEETVDPKACNTNKEIYKKFSRDPSRTPFPWDDSTNAGFSTATNTWLPVGTKYKTVNVKAQLAAENSHLKIFKRLTAVRKQPVFKQGNYVGSLSNNKNIYSYKRQLEKEVAIIVLNYGSSEMTVNLTKLYPNITERLKIYTSSLNSGLNNGDFVNSKAVRIKSNNGIVLLSETVNINNGGGKHHLCLSILTVCAMISFVLFNL